MAVMKISGSAVEEKKAWRRAESKGEKDDVCVSKITLAALVNGLVIGLSEGWGGSPGQRRH